MNFKLKNWKLSILALLFFCLFLGLSYWQLSRAQQKKMLLKSFNERRLQASLTINDLKKTGDLRFYNALIEGKFDNQHTFLLDNKTFHGQVGYEIYTPFNATHFSSTILVDRGFVAMGYNRQKLPSIAPITGLITIKGMLNFPPSYVALGKITDKEMITWPLRIEFIHLKELTQFLKTPLFPYILTLVPQQKGAYAIEWQAATIGPERHIGYALQWFALALTLLILFVILNRGSFTDKD